MKSNPYSIGVLGMTLGATGVATLPDSVHAESLPSSCQQAQFDAWRCYWLEGRVTENMCGAEMAPDIPRSKASAEAGNLAAAYRLGQLYAAATWGVERDYALALKWLSVSAEGGHRDGQIELAKMYRLGRGTDVNLEKAIYWYKQAVKQGPYRGIHKQIEILQQRLSKQ